MVSQAESVTLSTIHTMLAQVLEQTNALWQAQASTNHILDELRQSMPGPQENAEFDECLRRVETLVETLAMGQRVESHQLDRGTSASNAYQGGLPEGVPQPLFTPNIIGTLVAPVSLPGPGTSTQDHDNEQEVRPSTLLSFGGSDFLIAALTNNR